MNSISAPDTAAAAPATSQAAAQADERALREARGQSAEPSSEERLERALARMQASRAAMRRVLVPPQPETPRDASSIAGSGFGQRFADGWQHWRHAMTDNAAVSVAMDALHGWWRRQPLRPAIEAAASEIKGMVAPLVRKHPVLAVSLAATLGAALVFARPWHSPALKQHLADAPRRAGRWLYAQLTHAPVQSLLASLFVGWLAARKTDTPDDAAPAAGVPSAAPPVAAPPVQAVREPHEPLHAAMT